MQCVIVQCVANGWGQFFFIRFQAVNTIQAWPTTSGLNLVVTDLFLDGAPPELELNDKLGFDLKGQLRVVRTPEDPATGTGATCF